MQSQSWEVFCTDLQLTSEIDTSLFCSCCLLLFSDFYLRRRRRLCFWFGLFVCLFVCLYVGLLTDLWTDFDEIFWRVGHGSRTKWYNFGGDPDRASDPGVQSPKSGSSGSAEVCALWVLLVWNVWYWWTVKTILLFLVFCLSGILLKFLVVRLVLLKCIFGIV